VTTGCAQSPVRDEAQMISAILERNTELYHTLFKPCARSVYRMALSFVKNESEAEDVAQGGLSQSLPRSCGFSR
jgi:RNA polymerase sigma-70 factor (ECF subfamily)